ncbi:unnamed protein product, partial [Hapterophycus canaliculatus]
DWSTGRRSWLLMGGRYLVVVWDAWFCEGSKVIFRYGLALLKMYKKRLKAQSECG